MKLLIMFVVIAFIALSFAVCVRAVGKSEARYVTEAEMGVLAGFQQQRASLQAQIAEIDRQAAAFTLVVCRENGIGEADCKPGKIAVDSKTRLLTVHK